MSASPRGFRFGPFELQPSESILLRDGEPVAVQPKTFEALVFFVERSGQLVTREEVYAYLWPDTFVNEEALTQVIRKLRLALGDDAKEARYLQTVLKRGYRFLATVTVLGTAGTPANGLQAEAPPAPTEEEKPSPGPRARWLWAVGALAAIGLAVGVLRQVMRPPPTSISPRLEVARLTSTPEREQEPVFSPDGKTYAYAAYDAAGAQFDIHLAAFAGGRRLRLTRTPESESFPQFSPDGRQLSFTRFGSQGPAVFSISPLGGNERLLVADALSAIWSPDGSSLAYVRRSANGGQTLDRLDLRSGDEREVCRFPWIASPAWSPDGRRIAFTDERSVWVVDAEGGTPARVGPEAESIRSITWEPTSEAILSDASWGGVADLWRHRLAGGPPEPVTAMRGAFHPAVSRDGLRVLVAAEHKIRQLWRTDNAGGNPHPLDVSTTIECLDIEPAGRWILASDWSPKPGETSLVRIDLEDADIHPLADGVCGAVSPNGLEIAYFGDRGGLWTLDLDRGARRRLVESTLPDGFVEANLYRRPAWSPDGQRLAYPALEPDAGLKVIGRDGSGLRILARGTFGPPAWSPDGTAIAALGKAATGSSGLFVLDVEGGEARVMGPPWHYARAAPVWDRDGRSVRILVDEARNPALLRLRLADAAELERRPLARPQDPAFWGIFDLDVLPDGGLVYLLERYEGDLYLLSATPGSQLTE